VRCLNEVWESGMGLLFMPHLEVGETLVGRGEVRWRNHFSVVPDDEYDAAMFGPFLFWLTEHARSIARSDRAVDVMLASEIDRSLSAFPRAWQELVALWRKRLQSLGLLGRVRLGLNPNWHPHYRPADCAAAQALWSSVDFLAPSLYGDLSTVRIAADVEARRRAILEDLTGGGAAGARCRLPQLHRLAFTWGEVATGAELTHAERPVPCRSAAELTARRALVCAVMEWTRSKTARDLPVTLWTVGLFDPFGIEPTETTGRVLDSALLHAVRQR
jgi:hypothetical protein